MISLRDRLLSEPNKATRDVNYPDPDYGEDILRDVECLDLTNVSALKLSCRYSYTLIDFRRFERLSAR